MGIEKLKKQIELLSQESRLVNSSNETEKFMIEKMYNLILVYEYHRNDHAGETNIDIKKSIIDLIHELKLHRNNAKKDDENENRIFKEMFDLLNEVLMPSKEITKRIVEQMHELKHQRCNDASTL